MVEDRPFQRLDDRLAGRPVDRTLHDGVPDWLEPSLRDWLGEALRVGPQLSRRVMLRLKRSRVHGFTDYQTLTTTVLPQDLLTVVDATLQLHPGWTWPPRDRWTDESTVIERFAGWFQDLEQILVDGASLYRPDPDSRCLVRRVDPTVEQAVARAITEAPPTAADHLRTAWVAAYGLDPDPDKVFNEAIRAVEEIACPLVEQRKAENGKATLGTVIGELGKNASHKWELALPGEDGNPRNVEHLVGMMQMLWQAQVSRHGGAPKSRRQDQTEAEAAVHLAALLVQWLSAGVLRRPA